MRGRMRAPWTMKFKMPTIANAWPTWPGVHKNRLSVYNTKTLLKTE